MLIEKFNKMIKDYARECARIGEFVDVNAESLLTKEKVKSIYKLIVKEEKQRIRKRLEELQELLLMLKQKIEGRQEYSVQVGHTEKCIKHLGCFNSGPPFFHPFNRPVSFLPKDREKIGTKFLLYTNRNPWKHHILVAEHVDTIRHSFYDPRCPTKIIVHGFTDSIIVSTWMTKMKNAFLSIGKYNVIVTEWVIGSLPPYGQATANCRVVGAEIAFLIKSLQHFTGAKAESFHIIGHSLGAHIGGYVGERIKNLGRITGMDPAGPYFQEVSVKVRLDPTDALFVDVIHTNAGKTVLTGFGTDESIGHVDFYPNGGNFNPGCHPFIAKKTAETLYEFVGRIFSCNHERGYDFFIASITNDRECYFVGAECYNYKAFATGKCNCRRDGGGCAVMGLGAEETWRGPRVIYLKTDGVFPFCVFQYQIIIQFEKSLDHTPVDGEFFLSIHSKNGNKATTLLYIVHEKVHAGGHYTFLMKNEKPLGPFKEVLLTWKNKHLDGWKGIKKSPSYSLHIEYIKINPITIYNISGNQTNPYLWCGTSQSPLHPDMSLHLTPINCTLEAC